MTRASLALLSAYVSACGETECEHKCASFGAAGASTLGAATCVTAATPDSSFSNAFNVDTSAPGSVGANYGQTACADQYVVDVDLTQEFQGKDVFMAGLWSAAIPNQLPCDEQATLTAFAFDGKCWRVFDQVHSVAAAQGTACAITESHTNSSQAGVGGVKVTPANQFQRVRLAVNATQADMKVAVTVFGHVL
jgi:hypothetical protein